MSHDPWISSLGPWAERELRGPEAPRAHAGLRKSVSQERADDLVFVPLADWRLAYRRPAQAAETMSIDRKRIIAALFRQSLQATFHGDSCRNGADLFRPTIVQTVRAGQAHATGKAVAELLHGVTRKGGVG